MSTLRELIVNTIRDLQLDHNTNADTDEVSIIDFLMDNYYFSLRIKRKNGYNIFINDKTKNGKINWEDAIVLWNEHKGNNDEI